MKRFLRSLLSFRTVIFLIVGVIPFSFCVRPVQRLRAIYQIERAGGVMTFRDNTAAIPATNDYYVRLRCNVERIYLVGPKLESTTLALLSTLSEAHYVSFQNTALSDDHVAYLDGLPNLKAVRFVRTTITDFGIAQLSRFPLLAELTLHDTGTTDTALNALTSLTSLKTLILYDTQLSDNTVPILNARLPGCKIFHSRKKATGVKSGPF